MDTAIAGFLGALVGGAATFGGTVVSNTQQARRERKKEHEQRKVEAYSNSMRSLLRVAHRRSIITGEVGAIIGKDMLASWFDDIVDAEYWLTILSAACGSRYRESIQKTANKLLENVNLFTRSGDVNLFTRWDEGMKISAKHSPQEEFLIAYRVVAEAARDDIGFTG
jgi:hypothetical protein